MSDLKSESFVSVDTSITAPRSVFDHSFKHSTSINAGELVPIFIDEVLPGSTISLSPSFVTKMLQPAVPVRDNAYQDVYFFFVPRRLCRNKFGIDDGTFQKVMGENRTSAWAPASLPLIASLDAEHRDVVLNSEESDLDNPRLSVGSYFGLPTIALDKTENARYLRDWSGVSSAPFFAYQTIWNDYFRDQNLQNPSYFDAEDVATSYCFSVCKLHDVFTSALPSPQKGDPVRLSLAASGFAPLAVGSIGPQTIHTRNETAFNGADIFFGANIPQNSELVVRPTGHLARYTGNVPNSNELVNRHSSNISTNLGADVSMLNNSISVNDLDASIKLQRQRERDARTGNRYFEYVNAVFGVGTNYASYYRAEYLYGKRTPITIDTVLQTSATENGQPLGQPGAFSNTVETEGGFTKSFSEHGYVIGLTCIRTLNSYSNGISRRWRRLERNDFYDPRFAHMGEQPIRKREIDFRAPKTEVFGYQENGYDYRYKTNRITGLLNPYSPDVTMSKWTYADEYSQPPVLNEEFIRSNAYRRVAKTLTYTDTDTQFICDIWFDCSMSHANMPVHSIPGRDPRL